MTHHTNLITAREALEQGSTPSLFFSIARFTQDAAVRNAARERGRELARMIGMDLGGRRRGRPANDNRRQGKKRRAA